VIDLKKFTAESFDQATTTRLVDFQKARTASFPTSKFLPYEMLDGHRADNWPGGAVRVFDAAVGEGIQGQEDDRGDGIVFSPRNEKSLKAVNRCSPTTRRAFASISTYVGSKEPALTTPSAAWNPVAERARGRALDPLRARPVGKRPAPLR